LSSDATPSADTAADRFTAALDRGDDPGDGDPDLAREIALAGELGALGRHLDPDPQARERARQRLLAALAREARTGDDEPAPGGPRGTS
jgi:hypothetical protein